MTIVYTDGRMQCVRHCARVLTLIRHATEKGFRRHEYERKFVGDLTRKPR
jgi:hypothetical protein